jgi:predicted nucleotidyltransferase
LLRTQFGAQKVLLFGSFVHPEWFTRWSDIDLAAWEIPHDKFYAAVAVVTGLSPAFKVDLVDIESCQPGLRESILREGREI